MNDSNASLNALSKQWKSKPPINEIKQILRQFKQHQSDSFHAAPRSAPIKQLVIDYADFLDQLLALCWHKLLQTESICLVAIGGYGRRELFPSSDIDLLIICQDLDQSENSPELAQFIRLLWDIGLNVGSSVRDIAHCQRAIQEDICFATAIIEAHFIAGHWNTFTEFREKAQPNKILSNRYFFEAKLEEQKQRYLRYEETGYNVEPNLKENPGGLRDIQLVLWIAKFYFSSQNSRDFIAYGYLTETEYQRLQACLDFLSIARFGLHLICERDENRLLFEYQRKLASLMGYKDSPSRLAVESLMYLYYRSLREVQILTELILQNFNSALQQQYQPNHSHTIIGINARFQIRNNVIECTRPHTFSTYPSALLEIFLTLQKHPELEGISAATIRDLHQNLHLIDDAYRNDLRHQSLFLEILKQPHSITRVFRLMHKYGVLAAYIPDFQLIQGLMQFDLFHVYTVDQHTIMTIRNVRRFFMAQFANEHATAHQVSKTISKPELLYLACFFHDIAKGRGGQHEILGAKCVELFCQTHRLNRADSHLCSWLVRHHLNLSSTAQKQDVNDPRTIEAFCQSIPSVEYLDMLYLLSIADVKATAPTLWNDFKNGLFTRLWQSSRQFILNRGEATPSEEDIISNIQQEATAQLTMLGFKPQQVMPLWDRLPNQYFLSLQPEQLTWQASYLCSLNRKTIIHCRTNPDASATELFVYCPRFPYQTACIASVLDHNQCNVMAASAIHTSDGYALINMTLLNKHNQPIQSKNARRLICAQIRKDLRAIQLSKRPPEINQVTSPNRRAKQLNIRTQIEFIQDTGQSITKMNLSCLDRPSLLSSIAIKLSHLGILITGAHITTVGAKAEDVFSITDSNYQPITNPEHLSAIKKALIEQLDD